MLLAAALALAPAWPAAAGVLDPAASSATRAEFKPASDRLLLRLTPGTSRSARRELRAGARSLDRTRVVASPVLARLLADARIARLDAEDATPDDGRAAGGALDDFWIVRLAPGADRAALMAALAAQSGVASVEPIMLAPLMALPDDSLFYKAWHLNQPNDHDIDAPEAWSTTTGDSNTIVAILDTGVGLGHPDLAGATPGAFGNLWVNRTELGGVPGVDDDGNGYVDDVHGWDFVDVADTTEMSAGEDWRDEDADPNDFANHGTAVSGVVAALTNNHIGVAGAAPGVRLMALRAGYGLRTASTGVIDLSSAARGILYAVRNGASVINCSFATTQQSDFAAAVAAAHAAGVIVVCSAGNNGISSWLPNAPDVIAVGATDDQDVVTRFSNLGDYVDLMAPGQSLPTTLLLHLGSDSLSLRTPSYTTGASGTSFSSPLVAAAAALVQSHRRAQGLPPLQPPAMEMRLRETSDDIAALNPGTTGYGSGRLNLQRALNDPVGSYGFACGSATVGPVAVIPGPEPHFAFVTADAQLLVTRTNGDTLARVTLPAAPLGGVASTSRGANGQAALFVALADQTIAGYDEQGVVLPGWPAAATGLTGFDTQEPAIGDIDGDNISEVVWGGNDGLVYAWHLCGGPVDGFPRGLVGGTRNLRVALAPMDNRAGAEIIAAASTGQVFLFNFAGAELPGWPVLAYGLPRTPLVIPNPNAPGERLVVMAGGNGLAVFDVRGLQVTWDAAYNVRAQADAVAGDLDGDGRPEVVILCEAQTNPMFFRGGIQIYNSFGVTLVRHDERLPAVGPPVLARGDAGGGVLWFSELPGTRELRAMRADGNPMSGFVPKSGLTGNALTLAQLDADSTLEIVAGCGGGGTFLVYDGGPALGARALWPTTGGNEGRTGNTVYLPPATPYSTVPPTPVMDLAASITGADAATVTWTAPADGASGGVVCRYDLRISESAITDATFDLATPVAAPVPSLPSLSEHTIIRGLREGVVHHIALRARGAWGQQSALSNIVDVTIATAAPAAVPDVRVTGATDTSLALAWTATGDDGHVGRPLRYVVRLAHQPMTEATFDTAGVAWQVPATTDAGGLVSTSVGGFDPAGGWYVALRAEDEIGLLSGISNVVAVPTTINTPAAVTSLALVSGEDDAVTLRWTATGDDGTVGRPLRYRVRAAHTPLTGANFESSPFALDLDALQNAGAAEQRRVEGVTPRDGWYVALRAEDEVGHLSPISNVLAVPAAIGVPAPVIDLTARMGTDSLVTLRWTATGDDGRTGRPLAYRVHAALVPFDDTRFDALPVKHSVPAHGDGGALEIALLGPLDPTRRWWFALKAEDDAGNLSAMSNTVSTDDTPIDGVHRLLVTPATQPTTAPVVMQWTNDAPSAYVTVRIFDIGGRLQFEHQVKGITGVLVWDGNNTKGVKAPPGVYLAEIRRGIQSAVSRIVLLK